MISIFRDLEEKINLLDYPKSQLNESVFDDILEILDKIIQKIPLEAEDNLDISSFKANVKTLHSLKNIENLSTRYLINPFELSAASRTHITELLKKIKNQIPKVNEIFEEKNKKSPQKETTQLSKKINKLLKKELEELEHNSKKCPLAAGFLMRRMLEKTLIAVYKKNNLEKDIYNEDKKQFHELAIIIRRAAEHTINKRRILSKDDKTLCDGIRFLGNITAHDMEVLDLITIKDINNFYPQLCVLLKSLNRFL